MTPYVGARVKEDLKVKDEGEPVVPMVVTTDSPAKRKIDEGKTEARSPIKFREFASVANMEASASKRPKVAAEKREEEGVEPEDSTTGTKETGKETDKAQKVVEKATVDVIGHVIHYRVSQLHYTIYKILLLLYRENINHHNVISSKIAIRIEVQILPK